MHMQRNKTIHARGQNLHINRYGDLFLSPWKKAENSKQGYDNQRYVEVRTFSRGSMNKGLKFACETQKIKNNNLTGFFDV